MDDDDYDYDEDADLLDSDCDDSVFSQSFFTLDSDASRTTWDESTMYTDALSSFNTMDHDDDSLSYTTGFTEYEKFKSVKSKKGNGGIGGAANKNMTTANFFTNFLNCNGPPSMTCGLDREEEDEEDALRVNTGPYSNIDTVAEAMASMSMAEPGEEGNTPRMTHHTASTQFVKSDSSMDMATRTNSRAISPESIKESGEELTLDTINPAPYPTSSARSSSGVSAISGGPPPSLDTNILMEDRAITSVTAFTSVTIANETSPLATIKQRFVESQDSNEMDNDQRIRRGGGRGGKVDEGLEFTLEEHQSSM